MDNSSSNGLKFVFYRSVNADAILVMEKKVFHGIYTRLVSGAMSILDFNALGIRFYLYMYIVVHSNHESPWMTLNGSQLIEFMFD